MVNWNVKHNFNNFLEYMHGQVRELCTNYGKIDILWFDFSYNNMFGEKWKATELIKMVRTLQPEVIIDNRLEASRENSGSIRTKNLVFMLVILHRLNKLFLLKE